MDAVRLAERQVLAEGDQGRCFWLTQQSVALARAKLWDEALAAAESALTASPHNAYALLAAADALHGAGNATEALPRYEEAAGVERVRRRAWNGMLWCMAELRDWTGIVAFLQREPSAAEAGRRWRVKALAGLGREDEALRTCREWLRKSPDNPNGLWALVDLEIRREGLESVMARMGKVARIPSRPPIYREIYASLCRRAGQPEKAAGVYEKMAQGKPTARVERKRAFALAKSGREAEAIPIMEELLRQDAADVYVHSAYAAACRRAGMLERAEDLYVELLERYPEEKGLYGRLRNVRRQRGVAPE